MKRVPHLRVRSGSVTGEMPAWGRIPVKFADIADLMASRVPDGSHLQPQAEAVPAGRSTRCSKTSCPDSADCSPGAESRTAMTTSVAATGCEFSTLARAPPRPRQLRALHGVHQQIESSSSAAGLRTRSAKISGTSPASCVSNATTGRCTWLRAPGRGRPSRSWRRGRSQSSGGSFGRGREIRG